MSKVQIGDPAFVVIAGTEYHGKVVGIGNYREEILYELEVPDFGVFYVRPHQIQKERTEDE
jgi:hypothetical protein